MAFAFIREALAERRQQHLFRQPQAVASGAGSLIEVDGKHYLNFSSNDYLGMRWSQPVLQAWFDGLCQHGGGSGSAPLVIGHSVAHQALQDYLAEALGREAVMLFSSGFAANQALCQALLQKNVTLLADKLSHASLQDAASQAPGQFRRFAHNDLAHLKRLLQNTTGDCLIASEGVFSMDGDQVPLAELAELAAQHDAWLMLDDAHGMGVLGEHGLGSCEALALSQKQVPVLMGTFGKAVGTAGAFVAGSRELIDYLQNHARHYIYSTAMPPAQAVATLASLQALRDGQQQQRLKQRIAYFRTLAKQANLPVLDSHSAIQPLVIGDSQQALASSQQLRELGIWVAAIRPPTVPVHSARLRITLTASHSEQDIQALVDALQLVLVTCKP